MTIANFEYPITLYHDNLSLEDWLANFSVEVGTETIEVLPLEKGNPIRTVAVATYCPTNIGGLEITRDMLVSMFSQADVREQELEASYHYLDGRL